MPEKCLANRFFLGDRAADAFGGDHGIKVTELRAWMWLFFNPEKTKYAVSIGTGLDTKTARLKVDSLISMGLARLDENDKCHVRCANRESEQWLEQFASKNFLVGTLEKRVERVNATEYFRDKTRKTSRAELSMVFA